MFLLTKKVCKGVFEQILLNYKELAPCSEDGINYKGKIK